MTQSKMTAAERARLDAIERSMARITFKPDGTIVDANENFLSAMGYSLDEIVGQHHKIFMDPTEAAGQAYASHWARLRNGEVISGRFSRLNSKGGDVFIEASYNPIFDNQGAVVEIVKYATDVTETEKETTDLRGQLDALSRSTAIISFTPDGLVLDANKNFLGAVGYALAEVMGKHHRMFVSEEEASSPEYEALWARLRAGEYVSDTFRRIRKDGSDLWIQASYNAIKDPMGRVYKVVKFATDITEQTIRNNDYEGQLAALSRSTAVISFSPDGTILGANDNFLGVVGYDEEDIVGKHHRMFVPQKEAASPAYAQFWRDLAAGKFQSGAYERVDHAGKSVYIQASYNPITDQRGKVYKVVKFASDITEETVSRKRFEGEMASLSEKCSRGDLSARGSTVGLDKRLTEIMQSVNGLVDAVQGPIETTTARLSDLAVGKVGPAVENK